MTTIKRDIILVVGPAPKALRDWIIDKKSHGDTHRYFSLHSKKTDKDLLKQYKDAFDEVHTCVFSKPDSIRSTLKSFEEEILLVTSRSEAKMWYFSNTIPHIPYVKTPTSKSLEWSVDKISMRRRFKTYDPTITPKFKVLKEFKKKTISEVEKVVVYPCVVKPSGLAQALLVTICYHQDELEAALGKVFKKVGILNRVYKESQDANKPTVLVEEYMEGDMYSIDGVVSSKGKIYFYPPVYVKTGEKMGFDDFFSYLQITPTKLRSTSIKNLEHTVSQSIKALGLRSSSFHAELLRTDGGWKMVEIGPRVGGFRQDLYMNSFGIDCTANDFAIRKPEKPVISKKVLGSSAALKIFARKEGKIKTIKGARKIQEFDSVLDIKQHLKKGDRAKYSKNGGKGVFFITLFNEDRSKLLADIRRIEKTVTVEV